MGGYLPTVILKLGKTLVVGEVLVKSSDQEALLAGLPITYYGPKLKLNFMK